MIKEDHIYNEEVNFLQGFFEVHPEYLRDFTESEIGVLSTYYFVDREVDVDNVFEYRRELVKRLPWIEAEAHRLVVKLWDKAQISGRPFHLEA